jgi:hypothetical protein
MPGETRSWTTSLKVPDALPTEDLSMEVKFHDEYNSIPTTINTVVPIRGRKLPQFGFTYRLLGTSTERIKPGTPLSMNIDVVNAGQGPSGKDTVAQLSSKSAEDVFIEIGRALLGPIQPHASKKASFRFHLTRELSEKDIELELGIFDSIRIDAVNQKIKIHPENASITPTAGKHYEPPVIDIASPPLATADTQWHLKGMIRDNEVVRDYLVFVGDKKVAYISNSKQTNELPIDVTLPLKPGQNMIVVAARDMDNLMSRYLLAIERTSGKKEEKSAMESMPVIPEVSE